MPLRGKADNERYAAPAKGQIIISIEAAPGLILMQMTLSIPMYQNHSNVGIEIYGRKNMEYASQACQGNRADMD